MYVTLEEVINIIYPNGVKIDNNEIRKMKLNKIKNIF